MKLSLSKCSDVTSTVGPECKVGFQINPFIDEGSSVLKTVLKAGSSQQRNY